MPIRVVIDPAFDVPRTARLFDEGAGPVMIAAQADSLERRSADRDLLETRGATFLPLDGAAVESGWPSGLPAGLLTEVLRRLRRDHAVTHILTEAGPGLLDALFDSNLVDAALVFTANFDFPAESTDRGSTSTPRRHLENGPYRPIWEGCRGEDRVRWWQLEP